MTMTATPSDPPTRAPTPAPATAPDTNANANASASATDQSQAFASRFLASVHVLDTQLATLLPPPPANPSKHPSTPTPALDPSTIADRLADLATAHRTLVSLERKVTDAITTHFLPAYDQYKYLTRLRQLGARIESARASLRAGQKFRFKARHLLSAGPTAADLQRASEEGRETEAVRAVADRDGQRAYQDDPSVVRVDSLADGQARVVKVSVPGADLHISNVGLGALAIASVPSASLDDGDAARAVVIAPPRALHLHKIGAGSVIYIDSPIDGSVLLESISNAVVVIAACRQLRVHHAHNVLLCVHVVSDPIIEDSSGVTMVAYPSAAKDQLWQHPNRYDQVKDFHWLVDSKPSPNWRVAEEDVAGEVRRIVGKVGEWVGWGFTAVPDELAREVKALCPAEKKGE